MAKDPSLQFKASKPFLVWMLILIVTFLTAVLVLFTPNYYYGYGKVFTTSLLFFAISTAIFLGLKWGSRKMLMWAGLLEFVILLLPLLSFEMNPNHLPYALTPIFILMFPVLWVMLPIGFFHLQDKPEDRVKLWKTLFLLAVVVGILWVAFGAFLNTYYTWDINTGSDVMHYSFDWTMSILLWSLVFLLPLAIWAYVEKGMAAGKKKGSSLGFVEKNLPEVLLVIVIIVILAAGYMMNQPYDDYYYYDDYGVCGDGICDWDDADWCPEDCGETCGDGYCTYDEDYFDSCYADCDRTVVVQFDREPDCELRLYMYSAEDGLPWFGYEAGGEFVFEGINADSVYVEISGTRGPSQITPITELYPGEETIIDVTLADHLCDEPMNV